MVSFACFQNAYLVKLREIFQYPQFRNAPRGFPSVERIGVAFQINHPVRRHVSLWLRHQSLAMTLAGGLWTVWSVVSALAVRLPSVNLAPYLIVVVMGYTTAELIHNATSNVLATEAAPGASRGRYLAVFQYSLTFATIIAPARFSQNRSLPWLVMGILAVLATLEMPIVARRLPTEAVFGSQSKVVAG